MKGGCRKLRSNREGKKKIDALQSAKEKMDNCFPLSFLHDEATIKSKCITHIHTCMQI